MVRFTIITVCFNAEKTIRKTVESVVTQTYQDLQYLIMDGGSKDRTLEIIQECAKDFHVTVYCEKDDGVYNAMNRGIARAEGDYIYFLNAGDTFYGPETLGQIVKYITDVSVIYYGKVIKCCGYKGVTRLENHFDNLKEKVYSGGMPCHQSIFAPRDTLRNHYFCEKYKIRADYEWLAYSISQGVVCKEVPIIVANYDMTGISADSKNVELAQSETNEIMTQYLYYFQNLGTETKTKIDNVWKGTAEKHLAMFLLMDKWFRLRQKKIDVSKYFIKNGYTKIAIYGFSYIGKRLLEELKGTEVEVAFLLDRNAEGIHENVKILSPDTEFPSPKAIIVTAITAFNDIRESLRNKAECPVLSFDDIINALDQNIEG